MCRRKVGMEIFYGSFFWDYYVEYLNCVGKCCYVFYIVGKSCIFVELEMNCNGIEFYIIIIKLIRVNVEKVYVKFL